MHLNSLRDIGSPHKVCFEAAVLEAMLLFGDHHWQVCQFVLTCSVSSLCRLVLHTQGSQLLVTVAKC